MENARLLLLATLFLANQVPAAELTGKAVYEGTCIACHGRDGKGAFPGVPDFNAPNGPLTKSSDTLKKHILEGFQTQCPPWQCLQKEGIPPLQSEISTRCFAICGIHLGVSPASESQGDHTINILDRHVYRVTKGLGRFRFLGFVAPKLGKKGYSVLITRSKELLNNDTPSKKIPPVHPATDFFTSQA